MNCSFFTVSANPKAYDIKGSLNNKIDQFFNSQVLDKSIVEFYLRPVGLPASCGTAFSSEEVTQRYNAIGAIALISS